MTDSDPRYRVSHAEFARLFESVKTWGTWGPDDELGCLNYITPEVVATAARLVSSGRTVTLALPLNTEAGPDNPKPVAHYMTMNSDFDLGSGSLRVACDYLGVEFHGDAHSHIDALCHVMYEGSIYNGVPVSTVSSSGASVQSIDVARSGIVTRGVLLDIPRLRGVPWLEPGETVYAEELLAAEDAQGVRMREGDVLYFRTGHHARRLELGPWDAAGLKAGLHATAMTLLHERRIAALGADGDSDAVPNGCEAVIYPIHALGMNAMGLHFLDSLQFEDLAPACEAENRWEFMTVIAPLRLARGTGSPVNPIAIF
jgi:kynurenine formamidase